jgi:hypothetical protein
MVMAGTLYDQADRWEFLLHVGLMGGKDVVEDEWELKDYSMVADMDDALD